MMWENPPCSIPPYTNHTIVKNRHMQCSGMLPLNHMSSTSLIKGLSCKLIASSSGVRSRDFRYGCSQMQQINPCWSTRLRGWMPMLIPKPILTWAIEEGWGEYLHDEAGSEGSAADGVSCGWPPGPDGQSSNGSRRSQLTDMSAAAVQWRCLYHHP